jgi:hypothetical protein
MNQLLLNGVYPGLTGPMLDTLLETIHAAALEFSTLVKRGVK